ncbi:hypothetical protein L2E82_10096 [Cichorium intybus]|uniref:Uncharacterized protein n=1 Tax=Cichorium intybus TaxID=13427 RepID=A0ACB9G9G0_CICIN|nr:hypothetical protein L2E82_10096 [Cichorium intybus]
MIQYGLECLWASSSGCRGDLFLIDTKFCQFLLAVETSLDWKTFFEKQIMKVKNMLPWSSADTDYGGQ